MNRTARPLAAVALLALALTACSDDGSTVQNPGASSGSGSGSGSAPTSTPTPSATPSPTTSGS